MACYITIICYDSNDDKFNEENAVGTGFIKFWWGDRGDGSGTHLQAKYFYLADGEWQKSPLNFTRRSGAPDSNQNLPETNNLEFLFGLSGTLPTNPGEGNDSPTFSFNCPSIMHSQQINGTLKSAYFLPLGGAVWVNTNRDGCVGELTFSGKMVDVSKVPVEIIGR